MSHVYNDTSIHCHMCFVCSERHLHIAGFDRVGEPSYYKGSIEYKSVGKLMQYVADNRLKWDENLDFNLWKERYGPNVQKSSMDINDAEHGFKADSWEWRRVINCVPYGESVEAKEALCCPEDDVSMITTLYASIARSRSAWSAGRASSVIPVIRLRQR